MRQWCANLWLFLIAPHGAAVARRWDIRFYLCLFVAVVGVVSFPSEQYVGDPLAVRAATWSLLERGTLSLPAELATQAGQRGQFFVQNPRTGLYYSKYGVLNTLFYLPALALEKLCSGSLDPYGYGRQRTLILNVHNLILSLILALLLYELALQYSTRLFTVLLWLGATLYASFGWNYLRAQTSELLQWLLATAFFLALVRFRRSQGNPRWLLLAQLALLALVLTKSVYVLCGFALVAVAWAAWRDGHIERRGLWGYVVLPLAVTALVVLACNYTFFGSPWASGYTQWERERHFFAGNIALGVWGFLSDPHKSVFLYEPLLLPSLVTLCACLYYRHREASELFSQPLARACDWPSWKDWQFEQLLAWGTLIILLLFNSCTINWGGHWSYGPRYLLAVLAPATLASLTLGDWLLSSGYARLSGRTALLYLCLALPFGVWMQLQVNGLNFFTYYYVEGCVAEMCPPAAVERLRRTPWPFVYVELRRFRQNGQLPSFITAAESESDIRRELSRRVNRNYYFFR